jgi:hypothetical protein
VDVNVLNGMLDITVVPSVAKASVDLTTGAATASCIPGLISVTAGGGAPNLVDGTPLGNAVQQLLSALYATALQPLLTALLGAQSNTRVLNCDAPTVSGSNSASDTGATANLTVLPVGPFSPDGLLGIKVGDVSAEASSTSVTPNVQTLANTTPPAAVVPSAAPIVPAAAAVPNVTTVHTGEFWSGWAGPTFLGGMGLLGLALVTRRRIFSVARAVAQRGSKFRP